MANPIVGDTQGDAASPGAGSAGALVWPVPFQEVVGDQRGLMPNLQFALYQFAMASLSRLPRVGLRGAAKIFASIGKRVDRGHAEAARVFLRQALNEFAGLGLDEREIERRVHAAYEHLFHVAIDCQRFDRRFGAMCSSERLLERVELNISPEVQAVMGKGCVMVSGHCGDWEMAARVAAAAGFKPFYIISKPPRNYPLSVELQRMRESWGQRLLPRRGAMQFAGEVVKGAGTLGMLLDQRARKRPVMAPFFGRPARCDRSAGVLLRRLRCPVVFVAVYKTGEDLRWRLQAQDILMPDDVVGVSPEDIATLVNQKLETMVLAEPNQYFWLHDRYQLSKPEMLLAEELKAAEASGQTQ
jgi:lauroyl/myristoyl acyltransferase